MPAHERILRKIEAAGFTVSGFHDALDDPDGGLVTVCAKDRGTGAEHTVTVQTQGAQGEEEALRLLADKVGVILDEEY